MTPARNQNAKEESGKLLLQYRVSIWKNCEVNYAPKITWSNLNSIYYEDTSVLLLNRPLVKFIQNYIREPGGVF